MSDLGVSSITHLPSLSFLYLSVPSHFDINPLLLKEEIITGSTFQRLRFYQVGEFSRDVSKRKTHWNRISKNSGHISRWKWQTYVYIRYSLAKEQKHVHGELNAPEKVGHRGKKKSMMKAHSHLQKHNLTHTHANTHMVVTHWNGYLWEHATESERGIRE